MGHLLNLLMGASSALCLAPKRREYQVDKHGFASDAKKLQGDFAAVGRDMRKILKRESANYRTR